jgi:hypothetical protein
MREKAAAQLSLDSFIVFAKHQLENGLSINQLIARLNRRKCLYFKQKASTICLGAMFYAITHSATMATRAQYQ